MFKISIKQVALIFCLTALAACGGGSPEGSQSLAERLTNEQGSNSGDGTAVGGDTDAAADVTKIGHGTGEDFVEEALAASKTSLQPGDSSTITVNFVDGTNSAITEDLTVTFSSDCYANGLADFDQTSVTTVAGRASVTYAAEGCSPTDVITASAEIEGATLRAEVELSIEADHVLSVQYVGAASNHLNLRGLGGTETTQVTFKLVGAQGSPIRNELVSFDVKSAEGGATIADDQKETYSDNSGLVTTVLQSGTVSSTVQVTATHNATGYSGDSEDITIGTGLPVNRHFSLSLTVFNPANAFQTDNVPVTANIIASDQLGNNVRDGTQVTFWSPESGNIQSSCTVQDGKCSATWISAAPRPLDGRLTIIAHTNGAEDFEDTNGNHIFDVNDSVWTDLGEPCIDADENGICDPGTNADDRFVDVDEDGVRDAGDGFWNGPCLAVINPDAQCPGATSVKIYKTATIVLSEHTGRIYDLGTFPAPGSTINISAGAVELDGLFIADTNMNAIHLGSNPMPQGTKISFTTDIGEIVNTAEWTVPNATAPTGGPGGTGYGIILEPSDTPEGSGRLTLEAEIEGTTTQWFWYVTDIPPGP